MAVFTSDILFALIVYYKENKREKEKKKYDERCKGYNIETNAMQERFLMQFYRTRIEEQEKELSALKEKIEKQNIQTQLNESLQSQSSLLLSTQHQGTVTLGAMTREDIGIKLNKASQKQVVYKIDGDFTGDITGDNVTVILMNGDMTGDIKSNDGNVVLIRGDITGDVVANKVVCPTNLSNASVTEEPKNITCRDCKYCIYHNDDDSYYCHCITPWKMDTITICRHYFEPKNQNEETIIKPNKVIYEGRTIIDLTTTDIESPSDIAKGKIGYLKTGERVVGTGEFVNKLDDKQYRNCADCGYAKPKTLSLSGIDTSNSYDCTKFNKLVRGDYCVCDKFIKKSCETCHYGLYNMDGEIECHKRGYCEYVPIEKMYCEYYIKRNPAKDVDSPELPVKTSFKQELKRVIEETPNPRTTIYK